MKPLYKKHRFLRHPYLSGENMTQPQNPEVKIYYENVIGLLVNCIENRDLRLMVDVLQDLARRFYIYLKLRSSDISIIKLKEMPYDNGMEVTVVNKYGLEITLRIFKTDKYVDNVELYYSLATAFG
jgi:hypothetical protein